MSTLTRQKTYPRYDETKAVQLAARLLQLRGGRMSYLKLLKLMYIVDREALLRRGKSVTSDSYVSMRFGPVLSNTYSCISEGRPSRTLWDDYIRTIPDHEIELIASPSTEALSEEECALIEEIFATFGGKSRWELVDYVHTFAEWKDPDGSMLPITIEEILIAGNISQEHREIVLGDLSVSAAFDELMERFDAV